MSIPALVAPVGPPKATSTAIAGIAVAEASPEGLGQFRRLLGEALDATAGTVEPSPRAEAVTGAARPALELPLIDVAPDGSPELGGTTALAIARTLLGDQAAAEQLIAAWLAGDTASIHVAATEGAAVDLASVDAVARIAGAGADASVGTDLEGTTQVDIGAALAIPDSVPGTPPPVVVPDQVHDAADIPSDPAIPIAVLATGTLVPAGSDAPPDIDIGDVPPAAPLAVLDAGGRTGLEPASDGSPALDADLAPQTPSVVEAAETATRSTDIEVQAAPPNATTRSADADVVTAEITAGETPPTVTAEAPPPTAAPVPAPRDATPTADNAVTGEIAAPAKEAASLQPPVSVPDQLVTDAGSVPQAGTIEPTIASDRIVSPPEAAPVAIPATADTSQDLTPAANPPSESVPTKATVGPAPGRSDAPEANAVTADPASTLATELDTSPESVPADTTGNPEVVAEDTEELTSPGAAAPVGSILPSKAVGGTVPGDAPAAAKPPQSVGQAQAPGPVPPLESPPPPDTDPQQAAAPVRTGAQLRAATPDGAEAPQSPPSPAGPARPSAPPATQAQADALTPQAVTAAGTKGDARQEQPDDHGPGSRQPPPLDSFDAHLFGSDGARAGSSEFTQILAATRTGRPGPLPHPAHQVAVQVQRAAADGVDRLNIQLRPAELGRVDVQLEFAKDGHVRAKVTVEHAATLDLFQRDARSLEKALQDAGLRTDSGSLSFNLRDEGRPTGRGTERRKETRIGFSLDGAPDPEPVAPPIPTRILAPGRVDVRV